MKRSTAIHSFLSGVLALLCLAGPPCPAEQGASVLISTAPVVTQTMVNFLETFGTLDPDPDQVLTLSLPHAGLINHVWVSLGQRVSSGDRLLEVVTAPDAHMQYLQAQSALDFARKELDLKQNLLGQQLATRAQVDAAKKNLQDARATLQALRQRGQDVAEETLRAPMDGIITRLDISQGQRVQADSTAMLIAAGQRLVARLGVEPEDLPLIQAGTPVVITPVFAHDVKINTSVREIHAMIDPVTQLVEVLVPITDQVDQLVLGSRVLGRIQLASHNTLAVPRSAVLTDDAGRSSVFVVNNGVARRVPVQSGVEAGDLVAVAGALNAGDTVVTSGNYELVDGMAVREQP